MKLKTGLMAAAAVVAMTASAHAQDSSSMSNADAMAQIKALQARVEALEQQLQGAKTKRGKHKTVVVVAAPPPQAEPVPSATAANAEMAAKLQSVQDELQAYEERSQNDHTRLSTLEQNFNDTSWSFDNARPTVKSGDGRFTMSFRVRLQVDSANFMQDSPTQLMASAPAAIRDLSSGALVRRAYFGVEGKAFSDFFYEFRLNGGGSNGSAGSGAAAGLVNGSEGDPLVNIARVAYLGIPHFELNAGVIEPAFMYEGVISSAQLPFIERPEIDNIAADLFGAGDSRRGIEIRYQKDSFLMPGDNLVLNAAFTGAKTGSSSGHGPGGDEQTQLLGRASYRFWSDGVSNASIGTSIGDVLSPGSNAGAYNTLNFQDRPEIRVDGTRLISTGGIAAKSAFMYAFDAGANFNNFYVGGEYANFDARRRSTLAAPANNADTPNFSGWYLEGSWVLTGEPKSYTVSATNNEVGGFGAPKVSAPFSWSGDSWGAWELTARYSDTDLNWRSTFGAGSLYPTFQGGINGGDERIVALGVNWYLNNNVKLQLNDLITSVDRFTSTTHDHAHDASQDFNTLALRLQFTN
jgi:phosphate-selective porin OprO/OprP